MIERDLDDMSAAERFFLRSHAFVSGDPGTTGGAVVWNDDGKPVCVAPISDVATIAQGYSRVLSGRVVMVLEGQYVTDAKRARSVLRVAFLSGRFVEAFERELGVEIELYRVAPSTWQAAQRRRLTGRSVQAKRGDGIKFAKTEALVELGQMPEYTRQKAPIREGIASAYGIGRWWIEATG